MCSIITMTKEFFIANYDEIVSKIYVEDKNNPHGMCALLDNNTFIQTMDVITLLNTLDTASWDRVWIHFRFATSTKTGINYTHGFYTKDRKYMVMHNGVMPDGYGMPVDSMWICDLIDTIGVDDAIEHLLVKTSFCNTFIIEVGTKDYHVVRCQSGTLYEDGLGNYSTHPIGSINTMVGQDFFKSYVKPKPNKWWKNRYKSYNDYLYDDISNPHEIGDAWDEASFEEQYNRLYAK